MHLAWCVFVVLMSTSINKINADTDIKFAAVIYRHGDRTPVNPYKTDPYRNRTYWPVDFGQLTNKGKLQHYELGKFFRERYKHLLSNEFVSREIYIQSTDYDRTIMSALANLAGLFPATKENDFAPNINWSPIPVHTIPSILDDLLAMKSPCPKYDWAMKNLLNSDTFKELDKQYAPVYEYVSKSTGQKVSTILETSYIFDTLLIEDSYNFTLPNWTKEVYPDVLKPIALKSFEIETYTKEMMRLKIGPLMNEITELMVVAGTENQYRNVVMYSAHDNTMANVLNSLGLFKPHLPAYACHLLFEVLTGGALKEPVVRLTYQNEVLEVPNCGKLCPVSEWKSNYAWLISDNHTADCMMDFNNTNWWQFKRLCGVFILLVVFCISSKIIITFLFKSQRRHLPEETVLKV